MLKIYGTENVTLTDVDTVDGTIAVSVTGADIIATAVDGAIVVAADTTVVSLTTNTSGNITLTHVIGTNTVGTNEEGNISISSAGSILGTDAGDTDVVVDDILTMTAGLNIGTSGAANYVEVDATTLDLTTSNGGMYIEDLGAGGVGVTANSQGTGDIVMTSTEIVTLTDIDTNQGAVTVTVTGAGAVNTNYSH